MTQDEFNNDRIGSLYYACDLYNENDWVLSIKKSNGKMQVIDTFDQKWLGYIYELPVYALFRNVTEDFVTPDRGYINYCSTPETPAAEPQCAAGCHKDYIGQHVEHCPWIKWRDSK